MTSRIWADNSPPDPRFSTQKNSRSFSEQIFRAGVALATALALVTGGFGCSSGSGGQSRNDAELTPQAQPRRDTRQVDDQKMDELREEMAEVFDEARPISPSGEAPPDEGWSIALAAFSGSGHRQRAEAALPQIRTDLGLRQARLQARDSGTAIVMGRYDGPGDRQAQQDLARVRSIEVDGFRPFGGAFLSPAPRREDLGSNPSYNLANARREFGSSVRYTLQIGVYESPDPREARRAAEQAAVELRREGEPAFYYHGSGRSMVTVGAFTERDAGTRDGLPGPLLLEMRRRHPNNLLNGNRTIVERVGGRERTQASFLVEIPQVSTPAR